MKRFTPHGYSTEGGLVKRADYLPGEDRESLVQGGDARGARAKVAPTDAEKAFNQQALELSAIRRRINDHTGIFEPKGVCGCMSPALLLWIINCVAFVVHLGMGIVVLIEGGQHPDEMAFQITQVIGTWRNLSARDGYTWSVQDSSYGKWRLDGLCAAFAFISAGFHFLVCCFSFFALSSCPCHLRINYLYYLGIERCLIAWRWIEYTFSAPIMTLALYLISGIREQNVIVLPFFLQAATMLTGLLTEIYSKPIYDDERPTQAQVEALAGQPKLQSELQQRVKGNWVGGYLYRLSAYLVGWFTYIPVWVVFITTFYDYVQEAKECCNAKPPDWIPLVIWAEVAVFTLFAIPLPIYQRLPPRLYWQTELIYASLSLFSKVLLNGILLSQVFILGRLDLGDIVT